jgi:hypothetical protein
MFQLHRKCRFVLAILVGVLAVGPVLPGGAVVNGTPTRLRTATSARW